MTIQPTSISSARQHFLLGMSRISEFWGFPKAMGAIYGALYLSPTPLSLDTLVEQAGVTKGAISTNVRALERLGMVHRHLEFGDRKDYYYAETDFWKLIRDILKEREKTEFDRALRMVTESLEMVDNATLTPEEIEMARFYSKRLQAMQSFFHSLDQLVSAALALQEFRLTALERLLGIRRHE